MIFKDQNETARLIADKIKDELSLTKENSILGYINPDSKNFCKTITNHLKLQSHYLPQIFSKKSTADIRYFLIIDNGDTRGQEYNEFTDLIHKTFPSCQIIIATPVIPQSEENILKDCSDRLLFLHIEPLFFSMSQFYETQK
jgi:predicted phosphoribosyltransferase